MSEIVIAFRSVPHSLFGGLGDEHLGFLHEQEQHRPGGKQHGDGNNSN